MIRPVAADGRIETGGAFTPIHRPRVVDRIGSAAQQRIVLIVAPAGYGKSVALRHFLDTLPSEHVRFDVHAEHATLLGFLRGFADALVDIAPDARKTISGAYEKSSSSSTPGTDLAMWMHAHIKTFTGVIAIDDLHVAENDPEISKFLVSLIERTKGRARWLIASRSTLDLPVGSWLAYGEMDLNIDEQDLRFTVEEARQTAKASRVAVRDEEIQEILTMTEGWPTAFSFAVRSSTRSVDLRNITATTRELVYRYLAEQVYRSLEYEERELLHFIGHLPEIDIDVLRYAGYSKAKAIVEALRDRVAFIYPDRPNVYRCHDLFRDFLQHQLELEGDGAVQWMQIRVATALEGTGHIAPALKLYAAVAQEDRILDLLERFGFQLLEQAHADSVAAALDGLSQETRATHTIALALRAQREADNGRFDRAESLFQRAISRSSNAAVKGDLAARLGLILFNQGREVVSLLEPIVADGTQSVAVAKAVSLLAPAYAYAGQKEKAFAMIELAEEYSISVESDEIRAKLLHRMGIAAMALSLPLEQVTSLYTRAQSIALENAIYFTAAAALGGLASVALFYEDDVTKSVWYAQQAMNAALKAGDRFSMQTALLQLIHVETGRGNMERLPVLEKQFSSVTTSDSSRMLYIIPTRAMMAAWEERFDEAYRLMSTISDTGFYAFDRAFNTAVQALYAVGCSRRDDALRLASRGLEEVEGTEFQFLHGRRLAEIVRLLCAVVEAVEGRLTNANRILQKKALADGPSVSAMRDAAIAISRACKNPALLDEIGDTLEQLKVVGYGGIATVLGHTVRRRLGSNGDAGASLLTRAEIEVLEGLAGGASPKEIALDTGRSVYTIQAHIQNIIKKLGCSGRNEALTIARKRGLLA